MEGISHFCLLTRTPFFIQIYLLCDTCRHLLVAHTVVHPSYPHPSSVLAETGVTFYLHDIPLLHQYETCSIPVCTWQISCIDLSTFPWIKRCTVQPREYTNGYPICAKIYPIFVLENGGVTRPSFSDNKNAVLPSVLTDKDLAVKVKPSQGEKWLPSNRNILKTRQVQVSFLLLKICFTIATRKTLI